MSNFNCINHHDYGQIKRKPPESMWRRRSPENLQRNVHETRLSVIRQEVIMVKGSSGTWEDSVAHFSVVFIACGDTKIQKIKD
jgi:hypothetical protein